MIIYALSDFVLNNKILYQNQESTKRQEYFLDSPEEMSPSMSFAKKIITLCQSHNDKDIILIGNTDAICEPYKQVIKEYLNKEFGSMEDYNILTLN